MKETDHIVSEIIRKGEPRDVVIEEDNLIKKLVNDDEPIKRLRIRNRELFNIPFQKGLRLLLIIATLVASAAFVLHYAFIYMKDVLMSKNELYVNSAGAFTPKKTIGREYGIYLFNTAELWANSGIRITKGDEVRISYSGAFHSSYSDLLDGARDNTPFPEIDWIGKEVPPDSSNSSSIIIDTEKQSRKEQVCLYNKYFPLDTTLKRKYIKELLVHLRGKKDTIIVDTRIKDNRETAHLGDLLYEIVPEYVSSDPIDHLENAHVWPQNEGEIEFTAEETGYLRFAVNDIYFKNETALREYPKKVDSLRHGKPFDPEDILNKAQNKDFRKIFYIDNVGQILVCVEIQHPLKHGFFNPMTAYRHLEKVAYQNLERKNRTWGILVSVLALLFVFLPWVTLIFALWILIIFVCIYIVFLIFFGIEYIKQKIDKRKEQKRQERKLA